MRRADCSFCEVGLPYVVKRCGPPDLPAQQCRMEAARQSRPLDASRVWRPLDPSSVHERARQRLEHGADVSSAAVCAPERPRRRAQSISESHRHVLLRGEPRCRGNFRNRRVGFKQQVAGVLKPTLNDDLVQGSPREMQKLPAQRCDRQGDDLRQLRDAERFRDIVFNIGYKTVRRALREGSLRRPFA